MSFANQVAIVTGGGRGIGRAIAQLFAEEGASVVVAARHQAEIAETERLINQKGGRCSAINTDIRILGDVEAMVHRTLDLYGRIDVLVNNAGVAVHKTILDTTEKEWDWIIDVNLKGPFLCSKAVLPTMLQQKKGTIINLSSGAGKTGYAELVAYCTSKFGVLGFTESLAAEVRPGGVRVFAVCPGGTNTDMYHGLFGPTDPRNLLSPQKVARKVLEVAGEHPPVIPGQCVDVFS